MNYGEGKKTKKTVTETRDPRLQSVYITCRALVLTLVVKKSLLSSSCSPGDFFNINSSDGMKRGRGSVAQCGEECARAFMYACAFVRWHVHNSGREEWKEFPAYFCVGGSMSEEGAGHCCLFVKAPQKRSSKFHTMSTFHTCVCVCQLIEALLIFMEELVFIADKRCFRQCLGSCVSAVGVGVGTSDCKRQGQVKKKK